MFGCAWAGGCLLLLSGARPLGLLLGRGRSAAVLLPSSGVKLGFRRKTKSGGLFMAQGFVTVFSRTSRVFSLVRLVVRKATSTTANSRLRNHSANLPSLQKAWRGSGAPVSAPQNRQDPISVQPTNDGHGAPSTTGNRSYRRA